MSATRTKEESGGTEKMQLYLKVVEGGCPRLVMLPCKDPSYPVSHIPLPGCIVDADSTRFEGAMAYEICGEVAKMCRNGCKLVQGGDGKDSIRGHLTAANEMVTDLMELMANEAVIGCKSIFAIASRINDRIVKAGKCVDVELIRVMDM